MHETLFEGQITKRSRPLIHALIISVALNLGLLATFITFIIREKKFETLLRAKIASNSVKQFAPLSRSNSEVLEEYENFSFARLVHELDNEELLEQGYRKRDLALACLVAYHHFDLQRALPGREIQKRDFTYSIPQKVIQLMPGIDQEKFQVIRYFARVEMWPLTSEGLFEEMKYRRHDLPVSLKEAFFLSKEFYEIERAFSHLPFVFNRETLLSLLLDGNWRLVKQAAQVAQAHPSGKIEAMGAFLANFENSKLAAYLLIVLDPDYPYTQFSNEQLEHFIGLLDQRTEEAESFLKRIIASARSDAVQLLAKQTIQSWGNEAVISSIEYIVQKGDSLWSLSQQFNLSIEKIREANDLGSDLLIPGQVLKIPHAQHNRGDNG